MTWERLKMGIERLEVCTERINQVIDQVNERLDELKPGVGAWVDDLEIASHSLGFAKYDGAWVLMVKDKSGDMKPLRSASREVRMLSLPHLDKVIDAISDRVEEYADHMEEMMQ